MTHPLGISLAGAIRLMLYQPRKASKWKRNVILWP